MTSTTSQMAQSSTVWMLTDQSGRILYADPDISDRLHANLPTWAGHTLSTFLPSQTPLDITPDVLAQAAEKREELYFLLQNGMRLRLSVRPYPLQKGALDELLQGQHPPNFPTLQEQAWIVCGVCEDQRRQQFENERRMRTTIGSIISGFAHEVRNPLAAILSLSEGVIHPSMDEETLRALSRIPFLVERIENLIKTALSYGKPRPPKPEWHQIGTLIKQSLRLVLKTDQLASDKLLPETNMTLPVFVDQDHTISILSNLIQNAIEEAGEGAVELVVQSAPELVGNVNLYCRAPALAVDIIDAGHGVNVAIQHNIFEPFFTTKSEGTGLGLALAREMARLNAGDITLLHSSQSGSTFRLYLPTHQAPEETTS